MFVENLKETINLGKELSHKLNPQSIVLLQGPIGAGKTSFVKGIAEGLSISDDIEFKHQIYTDTIHPAFMKLAENIINTFKFSYFDYGFRDLQEEVVSNLVINMHKFDETRGSKAFSYFSIVGKNYLLQ